MALHAQETHPGYLMGRLFALIERRNLPSGRADHRFDRVIQFPKAGLGLIADDLARHPQQDEIAAIMALFPPDGPPAGPVPVDDQMGFWLGYYHEQSAVRLARAITPDRLREIGEILYGSTWQTEMARALGWGGGGQGDSARVREVLSRRRKLPAGIAANLLALLRQKSAATRALADEIAGTIRGDDDGVPDADAS